MGAKFHKTKELCKKTQLVGFLTLGLFFLIIILQSVLICSQLCGFAFPH